MIKNEAKNIISENNLVPGVISRQILKKIISNNSINEQEFQDYISVKEFNTLKALYHAKVLPQAGVKQPKYFPFYLIACEKYPELFYRIAPESIPRQQHIMTDFPRVHNLRASLLSILIGRVNLVLDAPLNRKYPSVNALPIELSQILSKFMSQARVIYPNDKSMSLIVNWLRQGIINKVPSTIFIPICPDYAVEPTNDPTCPFRHTFQSIGSDIGQIPKRIIGMIPLLKGALKELNFEPKIIAGMADFEGFSEDNLNRLSIIQSEFMKSVNLSRLKFEEAAGVKAIMISEMLGGEQQWRHAWSIMKNQFSKNNFGAASISDELILRIVRNRQALYTRWYGLKKNVEDFIPLVLGQGAEYSLIGSTLSKLFSNCLILGADNNLFGSFYSYEKSIPALYLKRFYC